MEKTFYILQMLEKYFSPAILKKLEKASGIMEKL